MQRSDDHGSPDDVPSGDVHDLEDSSLLDVVTTAGAAVDRAQVAGDVAAHRVVQVVAECADGTPPVSTDIVAPPAVESERIAAEVADAAARYERARDRHVASIDDLAKTPEPEALDAFRDVAADSARAEAEATALLDDIDAAQRRLERRAATTSPMRHGMVPPDVGGTAGQPRLH